jgi:hypothetical protein
MITVIKMKCLTSNIAAVKAVVLSSLTVFKYFEMIFVAGVHGYVYGRKNHSLFICKYVETSTFCGEKIVNC